jgi:hypothetical protein
VPGLVQSEGKRRVSPWCSLWLLPKVKGEEWRVRSAVGRDIALLGEMRLARLGTKKDAGHLLISHDRSHQPTLDNFPLVSFTSHERLVALQQPYGVAPFLHDFVGS